MSYPSRYEEIKHMTNEQKQLWPPLKHLHDLREHMENEHNAKPEDYGDDVLGWHKKNWPLCNFIKEYYEKIFEEQTRSQELHGL